MVGLLAGCATPEPVNATLPSLYWPMATQSAQVDTATARDMISAYRARNGTGPLRLDPELQKLAEAEAAAMAAADRPSRAQTVKNAVERLGFQSAEANLSAGYHTLAEAFSGGVTARPTTRRCLPPVRNGWASPPRTRRLEIQGLLGAPVGSVAAAMNALSPVSSRLKLRARFLGRYPDDMST